MRRRDWKAFCTHWRLFKPNPRHNGKPAVKLAETASKNRPQEGEIISMSRLSEEEIQAIMEKYRDAFMVNPDKICPPLPPVQNVMPLIRIPEPMRITELIGGTASIFSGMLYCTDCGEKLSLAAANGYTHFRCSQYKRTSRSQNCTQHYIREDALRHLVLNSSSISCLIYSSLKGFLSDGR